MASHTTTSLADILKELYPSESIPHVMYEVSPTLALLPKWEKFRGNTFREGVVYRYNQGRSATFTTAQTNATSAASVGFDLSRVSNYAVATIDSELIEATQGDNDALVDGLELAMDGSLLELSKSYGIQAFRTSTGSRGQISAASNVATDTITLTTIQDITNFEVGMVLAAKAADTAGAVRTGTGVTIQSIDRDAGTITATGNWNAGAAFAASDYLYVEGDKDLCLSGFGSWIPSAAPSSGESFFGIDRSPDNRLFGQRLTGTGYGLEEALLRIQSVVCREGGTPDLFVMNNYDYNMLDIGLGSKVQYNRDGKRPAMGGKGRIDDIGFDTLRLMGDKGPIDIVADPFAPKGTGWCLTTKSWKLRTLGACPRVIGPGERGDGLEMLRQSSADGNEIRLVGRGNISCNAPGWNGRVSLQAL